jgi:hypothetical protein
VVIGTNVRTNSALYVHSQPNGLSWPTWPLLVGTACVISTSPQPALTSLRGVYQYISYCAITLFASIPSSPYHPQTIITFTTELL